MTHGKGMVLLVLLLAGILSVPALSNAATPRTMAPALTATPTMQPATPLKAAPAVKVAPKPSVSRVTPSNLKLAPGAKGQTVTLGGSHLNEATAIQVLRNNRPASGMSVKFSGPAGATARKATITAAKGAAPGSYSLRLVAGDKPITVSSRKLTISVVAPKPVVAKVAPAKPKPVAVAPARQPENKVVAGQGAKAYPGNDWQPVKGAQVKPKPVVAKVAPANPMPVAVAPARQPENKVVAGQGTKSYPGNDWQPVAGTPTKPNQIAKNKAFEDSVIKPKPMVKPAAGTTMSTTAPQHVMVLAATPKLLMFIAGAKGQLLTLEGGNLNQVVKAEAVLNGFPVPGIQVKLIGAAQPNKLQMKVRALVGTKPGGYGLRLFTGNNPLSLPTSTLAIVVKASQLPATVQRQQGVGGVAATTTPKMVMAAATPTVFKPVVSTKSPAVMTGDVATPGGSVLNPALLGDTRLNIQSPQAGQQYCLAGFMTIRWTRDTVVPGNVKIVVPQNGADVVIVAATEDDGLYDWRIPPEGFDSAVNKIRIEKINDNTVWAESGGFTANACTNYAGDPPPPGSGGEGGASMSATLTGEMGQGEVSNGGGDPSGSSNPGSMMATLGGGAVAAQSDSEVSSAFDQQALMVTKLEYKREPRRGIIKYVDGKLTEASNGLSIKDLVNFKQVTVTDSVLLGAQCAAGEFLRSLSLHNRQGRVGQKKWTGSHQSAQAQFVDFDLISESRIANHYCTEENSLSVVDVAIEFSGSLICDGREFIEVSLPYPVQLTCDTRDKPEQRTVVNYMREPRRGIIKYVDGKLTEASNGLSVRDYVNFKTVNVAEPIILGAQCAAGEFLRSLSLHNRQGRVGQKKWTGSHQSAQAQFVDFDLFSESRIANHYCTEENSLSVVDVAIELSGSLICDGFIEVPLPYPVQLTCDTRDKPTQ